MPAQHRSTNGRINGYKLLLLLWMMVFCRCGDTYDLYLHLSKWPTGTKRIRVDLDLLGAPTPGSPIRYVEPETDYIVVQLPSYTDWSAIQLVALDAFDCRIATNHEPLPVPHDLRKFAEFSVTWDLTARPLCSNELAPHALRWESPILGNGPLWGAWGSAWNDVWMVGFNGSVWHWDGRDWTDTSPGHDLELMGVWGSRKDDVWAVGLYGSIIHWNGHTWAKWLTPYAIGKLSAIWGSSANDLYAVGGRGIILHWNGDTWESQSSGSTDDLYAVWGSGPRDVWAGGYGGRLLHWDGIAWAPAYTTSPNSIFGIWGTGSSDVWIAGGAGTRRHWNGQNWQAFDSKEQQNWTGVWGSRPGDVWFIGGPSNQSIAHWTEGADWVEHNTGDFGGQLDTIWGSGPDDIWVAGWPGRMFHWQGTKWNVVSSGPFDQINSIWRNPHTPSDELWAFAGCNYIVGTKPGYPMARTFRKREKDGVWEDVPLENPRDLCLLAGSASDNIGDMWAIGNVNGKGTIQHYLPKSGWKTIKPPEGSALYALWTFSNSSVAVGDQTIVTLWGGGMPKVKNVPDMYLRGVWGSKAGDVWAVGANGTILHNNDSFLSDGRWRTISSVAPVNKTILAISGTSDKDAWAVGEDGLILQWQGMAWENHTGATDKTLNAVWSGGPYNVWAVGEEGTVVHWNGDQWEVLSRRTHSSLRAVWGDSSGVWIGGRDGTLLHSPSSVPRLGSSGYGAKTSPGLPAN